MSVLDLYKTMEYGPAPEEAAIVNDWLKSHGGAFNHFIGGKWTKPKTNKRFATHNPATGTTLATIADGDASDVDQAVKTARKALKSWQAIGPHGRARHLYALARQIQKHARFFSVLESLDNGKPIRETRDIDIPLVARHFYHHAGWAQLLDDEFPGHKSVGVVGQIIPWNFPLLMLAWKIAPALAAGCTLVLKPAEFTSLTALAFAEICQQAGLPSGVVNIVTGAGGTGEALVNHAGVDKIAFTGSTEVGRIIRKATAGTGKKISLELGGKSPFIVFADADLDGAVEGIVDGIWFNQGQVCCAGSRLLAEEAIYDKLIGKLKQRMQKLRMGAPLDKSTDIGAVVDPIQLKRITELVKLGEKEGAERYTPKMVCDLPGSFFAPTLFTNVAPSSTIAQTEIFGPVLVAMSFRTPAEAVELANNTPYGLAASIWSENINLALDIAPKLKAGVIWVNATNLFDAACGFGGYKESGYGREGGREGMYEYLKPDFTDTLPAYRKTPVAAAKANPLPAGDFGLPAIDQTAKHFIGGKQVRPDQGYSQVLPLAKGGIAGETAIGNRKDIRNAVEAARGAQGAWGRSTSHNRAQIAYFIAENLSKRTREFADRLAALTGEKLPATTKEINAAVERIFAYGAWADKYEGTVHQPPSRNLTVALNEPIGVIGVVTPDNQPFLSFISLTLPAFVMGNAIVAVPSERYGLLATDFYQVLETSDVPPGIFNIVTGPTDALAKVLAQHEDVDSIWYFGEAAGVRSVELESVGNLKRVWTGEGKAIDWYDRQQGEGRSFLRQATQVKNIWVPYGD